MSIQLVCDGIILFGSAYFMIGKLIDSFAKPTSKIKQKRQEEAKEKMEALMLEVLPTYLRQRDNEVRDKYKHDKENCLQEIKETVLVEVEEILEDIKLVNENQNKNMCNINEALDRLDNTTKDLLRQQIMEIYNDRKKTHTLPIHEKERLDELFTDYKRLGGNYYIDKYYKRMLKWAVLQTKETEEDELY